ncbi:MAG: AzlD domain-containing protein [Lachnospiraceae bacterium]|nr:AzlD domain-containing protein [Lachnospiraceae bacterium]
MQINIYLYILVMAGVTYLIRMLPLVAIRKEITNRFVKSFLYYVPYACLSAMTFPAMMLAPDSKIAGVVALFVGFLAAFKGKSLITVALCSCATVFVVERLLALL